MNSPKQSSTVLWEKWLRATGVDVGSGYCVPEKVWKAAWNGNWPHDEKTIRWILEKYLDVETAKAHGYFELIISLRQQCEGALNTAKNKAESQRQIKIDADIDEVIKRIQTFGTQSHDNGDPFTRLIFRHLPVFGEPLDTQIRKLRRFMSYRDLRHWFQQYGTTPPDHLQRIVVGKLAELRRRAKVMRQENAVIRELVLVAVARERQVAEFKLFGRGHEPRVTLDVQLAAVLRGFDLPRMPISRNTYYPARVFRRAITLLKRRLKRSPIALSMYYSGRGGTVYRVRD